MRKYLIMFACIMSTYLTAQEKLRITLNDGSFMDFSTNTIDNFMAETSEPLDITGEWISVSNLSEMQCYIFSSDDTYEYSFYLPNDNYINYINGTYTAGSIVINLNSKNTNTKLIVPQKTETEFTNSLGEVFYKVQQLYDVPFSDSPIDIGNDGDMLLFSDEVVTDIVDNKVKLLKNGRGYVLAEDAITKEKKAYRINVTGIIEPIKDWTIYFGKTREELISEFGIPNYNVEKYVGYEEYNSNISLLRFYFSNDAKKVIQVCCDFYEGSMMNNYCDSIDKYYYIDSNSTETEKLYYDTENKDTASIGIIIETQSLSISYNDVSVELAPVQDWTSFLGKSKDEIEAELGMATHSGTENEGTDKETQFLWYYIDNRQAIRSMELTFIDNFSKLRKIELSFKHAKYMQNYIDAIAEKYILDEKNSTKTHRFYYDKKDETSATILIEVSEDYYRIYYNNLPLYKND